MKMICKFFLTLAVLTGCSAKGIEHQHRELADCGTGTAKIDIAFLVDVSGSFSSAVGSFKTEAARIVNDILATNPDTKFGLATFCDYPLSPYGGSGCSPYIRRMDLTDGATVTSAIQAIPNPTGGSDGPESQLAAVFQAATGAGQTVPGCPACSIPAGQGMSWRADSQKLILLWTDNEFHDSAAHPGPTEADVLTALSTPSIKVVGLARGSITSATRNDLLSIAQGSGAIAGPAGVDCTGNGITDIPEGAPIVCETGSGGTLVGGVTGVLEGFIAATPPVAVCTNVMLECPTTASVDGGSSNYDSLVASPPGPYGVGINTVTLLATNCAGTATCTATVTVAADSSDPNCKKGGSTLGDPHFKTWQNEHFEYHGQCDLVLTKDPNFYNGRGIDVHIRTKLVRNWSYIKNAVIRIGNDILEIQGSAVQFDPETHYWMNYEYQADLAEFAGFPVKMFSQEGTATTKNRIEIDLGSVYPGQKIVLSTFKEFVKVAFENATEESFGNTVGMLGDFKSGKTLARDGVTVLDDFAELGYEWQVIPSDKHLFRETSAPQFPESCIEPEDPRGDRRRRLDGSEISGEQAEAACAGLVDELDRKDCVYDILATQDLDMVGAY